MNTIFESTTHKIQSAGIISNTPEPIRIITVRAFEQRLTTAERHAMRNSPDIDVEDIYISALRSTYVDLDDPMITQGLQYILYSLLTVPSVRDSAVMTVLDDSIRLSELLVSGTEYEAF